MTTIRAGSSETVTVPAGQALTVIADAQSSGRIFPFSERPGDTAGLTGVAASATVIVGPYATITRYTIEALTGSLSYGSAAVDFPTSDEAVAAAATAAALLYLPVSGTIGDLKEYVGAGVPVDYTDGTPPATGEGVAGIGSRYTDITNGKLYINGGTKAQPLWKLVTSAS